MQKVDSGGLPAEYRKIEWLGNSGTQYIATNYIPSIDGIEVTMQYMITERQTGDGMFWGAQGSATSHTWQCELYNERSWYVGVGYKQFRNVLYDKAKTLNTKYKLQANSDELTIDGNSAQPTESRQNSRTEKIYLFAWKTTTNTVQFINKGCKIYTLEFKNNGVTSANFVPCVRKSDDEPGMYETVSGTFYTNAGTGTFLIPS